MADDYEQLKRRVDELEKLFFKDNFTDLEIFRKKVEFKSGVDMESLTLTDLASLTKSNGANVIADNVYTFNTGSNTQLSITTKNGVIIAITIS
jgi:hypothetical protein